MTISFPFPWTHPNTGPRVWCSRIELSFRCWAYFPPCVKEYMNAVVSFLFSPSFLVPANPQDTEVKPPNTRSCWDLMTVSVGPWLLHLEWKVAALNPSVLPFQSSLNVTLLLIDSFTQVCSFSPWALSETMLLLATKSDLERITRYVPRNGSRWARRWWRNFFLRFFFLHFGTRRLLANFLKLFREISDGFYAANTVRYCWACPYLDWTRLASALHKWYIRAYVRLWHPRLICHLLHVMINKYVLISALSFCNASSFSSNNTI